MDSMTKAIKFFELPNSFKKIDIVEAYKKKSLIMNPNKFPELVFIYYYYFLTFKIV